MGLLNVSGIGKKEGEIFLLKNINFLQEDAQNIAIAGSTGSGKTTLLKMIAGLVQPTTGEVFFEGERVKGPHEKLLPGHPSIAYLSQHFELRNNYRVEEILQMANRLSANDAAMIYEVCRISHLLQRWTDELSGGEKQRIAFAKTLISAPKLLLLDEPFSNLDMMHKNILKEVINDIGEQLKLNCILVSHDPLDLLSWADEIIVLQNGIIVQKGIPAEIYRQSMNEYVAGLFGRYNLLTPHLAEIFSTSFHERRFLRPSDFRLSRHNGEIEGKIVRSNFMGSYYEFEVELSEERLFIAETKQSFGNGDTVYVSFNPGH